jgi:hypothetical protein
MKLVDDVHLLWRRWSTRIAAAQAGLVLFWTGLPDDWRAAVPGWVLAVVVGLFALTFISAQAVKQDKLDRHWDSGR